MKIQDMPLETVEGVLALRAAATALEKELAALKARVAFDPDNVEQLKERLESKERLAERIRADGKRDRDIASAMRGSNRQLKTRNSVLKAALADLCEVAPDCDAKDNAVALIIGEAKHHD